MNYNEETYTKISINNLILTGIYNVTNEGDVCTYERLIKECFQRFPKVFAFKRYPQWPDSLKFGRPLRKLREKGLIVGSIKEHFLLTEFGKKKAIETEKTLKSGFIINRNKMRERKTDRSTDDRIIAYLNSSKSFNEYLNDPKNLSLTEEEFRNLLRCTMETPLRIIKQNLEYYINTARYYNDKKLLEFLLFCKNKFLKGK